MADAGIQKKEIVKLGELNDFLFDLLTCHRYVAKSEFLDKLKDYSETIEFFKTLDKGDMLGEYCQKNRLSSDGVKKLIELYSHFDSKIDEHNDDYIDTTLAEEKEYLDNILKDVDPNISLDENQRRVVLTDEDYLLVIAGAGAGKTTTVAAKAKYLVEKKGITPNEILIVSFTNKAVDELRDRINNNLKLDCVISTFHAIGNAILKKQSGNTSQIVSEGMQYYVLLEYFKNAVFTNESLTRKLVQFFATYFDAPAECDDISRFLSDLSRTTYTTLRGDVEDYKQEVIDKLSKKKRTIQNEIVRSYQEVQIANYLYLNSIDYKYEPVYKYNIRYSNKPYTPDFIIKQGEKTAYIEHFGITQNGENNMYTEAQLAKYKKSVNDKIKLHKDHGTKLIYTFSGYNDGRQLIQHLDEELRKNGFTLKRRNESEVLNKIIETEESKYVGRLLALIIRFINLFKTNGYTVDRFDEFKNSTQNVRNRLFLDIAKECYLEYERYLSENNSIDFQDMINDSAAVLEKMAEQKEKLRFKYVIVDEYQDISRQRFDLVGAMHKVCDAKVIAVGDDWQSIYAFSGSNIELFLDFQKRMGYAKELKIENTYRNSQEIINIAGNFIQKNEAQIKKTLRSPKHIEEPVIIYTYDQTAKKTNENNKSGASYNIAVTVEKCLSDIVAYNEKENKKAGSILILGRYNFDSMHLENSGLFEILNKRGSMRSLKYPELNLTFMTAHASKGLGYDDVIIINCANTKFGFPSKIQDDPVLKHVINEDKSYAYAEERRLFYVAMTRTKNRVFCVAPQAYPSEFLVEIYKDYDNITKHGEWDENAVKPDYSKTCPICGYPLQFRYKPAFGLRLYICTNEPEICGFMTNEIKAGSMQIMKCDKCQDGYLIVRKRGEDYFLGCTNYKEDRSGCNNMISRGKYFEMMGLTPDKLIDYGHNTVREEKTKTNRDMTIIPKTGLKYEKRAYNIWDTKDHSDFYEINRIIISCVDHISQKKYLGAKKTTDILMGKAPEKLYGLNLNQIPEFGILFYCNRKDIETIIVALIRTGMLLKTKGQYPTLHPTNEGKAYYNSASKDDISKVYKTFNDIREYYQNRQSEQKTEPEKKSVVFIDRSPAPVKKHKKSILESILDNLFK